MVEIGLDSEKVGTGGWSYGGYFSALQQHALEKFKASMVGAGLTNMISFMVQPIFLEKCLLHIGINGGLII